MDLWEAKRPVDFQTSMKLKRNWARKFICLLSPSGLHFRKRPRDLYIRLVDVQTVENFALALPYIYDTIARVEFQFSQSRRGSYVRIWTWLEPGLSSKLYGVNPWLSVTYEGLTSSKFLTDAETDAWKVRALKDITFPDTRHSNNPVKKMESGSVSKQACKIQANELRNIWPIICGNVFINLAVMSQLRLKDLPSFRCRCTIHVAHIFMTIRFMTFPVQNTQMLFLSFALGISYCKWSKSNRVGTRSISVMDFVPLCFPLNIFAAWTVWLIISFVHLGQKCLVLKYIFSWDYSVYRFFTIHLCVHSRCSC